MGGFTIALSHAVEGKLVKATLAFPSMPVSVCVFKFCLFCRISFELSTELAVMRRRSAAGGL